MFRASRYRLYPNPTQEPQLVDLCGATRFVYNELLAEQIRNYQRFEAGEAEKPGISSFDFGKRFTQLRAKDGNEWLRELSFAIVRGSGAFPLATAFAHFFRRLREGQRGKQAGFPRFKAKGRIRESFTIPESVKVQNKRLQVPKVGWVRMKRKAESRTQGADPWGGGEARTAVVYRESDQWYVSVLWEVADADWQWRGGVCAVDRNVGNFAIAWEGQTKIIPIPHERIESYEAKARHYQWRASHREWVELKDDDGEPVCTKSGKPIKEPSKRRQRLQQRAAKAKRKAAGVRKDFSHQASAYLAQNFGHIVLENLNVQGMRKSAKGTLENPGKSVESEIRAEPEVVADLLHGDAGALPSLQGGRGDQGAGAEHQPEVRAVRAHRKGQSKDAGALPVLGLRPYGQRGRECRAEYPGPGIKQALGRRCSGDGTGRGQRSGGILHGMPSGDRQ